MNTGAEAVETAIKVARKWGYDLKGLPANEANIIVAADNFHGRTTTIVELLDRPARAGRASVRSRPASGSCRTATQPRCAEAIDEETVAVLLEPIQGEAGVIIPPAGYLAAVREMCTRATCCSSQTRSSPDWGAPGTTFACELEGVVPDMYVLGKALGGGIVPVSAVVSSDEVLGVLHPGNHGSTFGGNPLGAAVGRAVVKLLEGGEPQQRARELSGTLESGLQKSSATVSWRCAPVASGRASTSSPP